MKARASLLWIAGLLAVCSLLGIQQAGLLQHPLPPHTVLCVDGVALGDSRARVAKVLGEPVHEEDGRLYFGGTPKDCHFVSRTMVVLDSSERVQAVYGANLIDSQGTVLARAGLKLGELNRLLGRYDWIALPWCGNDTNKKVHLRPRNMVVLVDLQSNLATGYNLVPKIPEEPQDWDVNVVK